MKVDKGEEEKRIWKALKRYGIESEAELDREMKKMKPLNIGIMTSPIPREAAGDQ